MNTHFTVKSVVTDNASGLTKIVIDYNFGKGEEHDERGFENPDYAIGYINSMKASYISKMIELYVSHAEHIFKTSRLPYYADKKRLNSLQRCKNAVNVFATERSLPIIASYLVSSEILLRHILPHPSNPSFESSEERLAVILQIAKPLVKQSALHSQKQTA